MSAGKPATSSSTDDSSLPAELVTQVSDFDSHVRKASAAIVDPLVSGPSRNDLLASLPSAADRAKVDLACAFALNSLAWLWLRSAGADPRATDVKQELDRVRGCMQRLKEVEIRAARPTKVDAGAAKRFVKSGLWQPDKDKKRRKNQEGGEQEKKKKKNL